MYLLEDTWSYWSYVGQLHAAPYLKPATWIVLKEPITAGRIQVGITLPVHPHDNLNVHHKLLDFIYMYSSSSFSARAVLSSETRKSQLHPPAGRRWRQQWRLLQPQRTCCRTSAQPTNMKRTNSIQLKIFVFFTQALSVASHTNHCITIIVRLLWLSARSSYKDISTAFDISCIIVM